LSSISGKNVHLSLTFDSVETQLWVTKAVRQRIPSRRARNSKTPTTETIQIAVWSTCAEWHSADVDDQWRLLLVYNCPSSTTEQFHGGINTSQSISVNQGKTLR